ncbi:MAG: C25 family cysteine peptidase, partial [Candidatus Krumholzibacteriia bacterium]
EKQFAWSERNSLAAGWRAGTPVSLVADTLFLDNWLAPLFPGTGDRPVFEVRQATASAATPPLRSALSRGGLIAHYQGHANAYVLSSEYWLQDAVNARRDISLLTNTGKPWVFFGMGCHIADWAQDPVTNRTQAKERSLTEKMLLRTDAGASAGYASSGYEYIFNNRVFGERMFRIWTRRPPVVPAHGGSERSRWLLGELMWAAEAEHLAATFGATLDRMMVAQYVLLGDPLMTLDAGPPQVTAVLEGSPDQEIAGSFDLVATDPGNRRTLRIGARDEAGIDRLRVVDSDGVDLTGQVVVMADSLPPGQSDHQEVHYRLEVPVRPYPHSIDVQVWDTGTPLPTDPHWTLTLTMGQEVAFTAAGQPVDPNTFTFTPGEPVDFQAVISGAAWLHAGTTWALTSPNLTLTNVVLPSLKDNTAELSFTATAPEDEGERSVVLTIDGHATTWVLQAGEQAPPTVSISRVYSFPNPMAGQTRFLFETGAAGGQGVIRVFSVAGRTVARIPFSFGGGGAGVVEWNGRDSEGDELANGTYLYRVELDAPGGRVASPVQRLVVMR